MKKMKSSLRLEVAHRPVRKPSRGINANRKNSRKNKSPSRHRSNAIYAKSNSILGMPYSLISRRLGMLGLCE
jgi:hypothetical protein